MGVTCSRPDEGGVLYLRDQNRLSISQLVITSARRRASINVTPNGFPATRVTASRSAGDFAPLEFAQDTEAPPTAGPAFLLKLPNDEELTFTFTFVIRQAPSTGSGATVAPVGGNTATSASPGHTPAAVDTAINGLTFLHASNEREVDTLMTREFQHNPNLHKNANVELVGDFSTGGSPSVTFDWSWQWKPPKSTEDRGGGWRNTCSFVEYDQRAHKLETLASFSFYVSNTGSYAIPGSPTPPFLLSAPPKIRVASSQSVDSRKSAHIDTIDEVPNSPMVGYLEPTGASAMTSPLLHTSAQIGTLPPPPAPAPEPVRVDISCPKPNEDVGVDHDGPLFRATMKALEQKTGNMRTQMKKVIKRAETAYAAMVDSNEAFSSFIEALKETSSTNANAVQPAIDHYFDKIAREILSYERQNTFNLQRIVIDPLNKLYTLDIKQAEAKRRDFDEESKDYYAYVSRYLGQRQDSVKTKKLADSDSKYQSKRRTFELKRFDYSSFMQDLSGGRKEQEVLSHLTRFADAQAKLFLSTAHKVDGYLPQLEALSSEVMLADKEYQYQRREREEKRRHLEKSNSAGGHGGFADLDNSASSAPVNNGPPGAGQSKSTSEGDLGRADSTGSQLRSVSGSAPTAIDVSRSPGSLPAQQTVGSPPPANKFKGIRDLEERDANVPAAGDKAGKEGLLWALNRPGGHVDPRAALNKQGWHKFWIVLDKGKLSEYSNWKQQLDLHMEPIDLRMASVREARNAERRFTFEVITPHFRRVYQATSEEDMNSWISAINNALQSAMEGRNTDVPAPSPDAGASALHGRDIGSMFSSKSTSLTHGHRGREGGHGATASVSGNNGIPARRITVGGRPNAARAPSSSYEENPDKLLQMLRDNDQGNRWCADCGSGVKVEWVSINLAIILCIECSGIHRSLGTHISKVRSLTLDINSFTTDIIELLLLVGNRVSNMVWEAKLDPGAKLTPQANREQRLRFITKKYVDRAFVEPISPTLSRHATPDDTLLAGIKKNDVQLVIYALALRANPNATDKMRGTHAIFLALAAADPASPSGTPGPPSTPRSTGSSGSTSEAGVKTVPFPVAELLIQNGAQIPATMPAFPLGRSALQFIDVKRGRTNGGLGISGISGASGVSGASMPGETNSVSPNATSPTPASAMDRLAREKEARLQKRVSAGGRLARSPIPER